MAIAYGHLHLVLCLDVHQKRHCFKPGSAQLWPRRPETGKALTVMNDVSIQRILSILQRHNWKMNRFVKITQRTLTEIAC